MARKHVSVIRLINALEGSTMSSNLKEAMIQEAFQEGTLRVINDIVEKFHEHPQSHIKIIRVDCCILDV